VAFRENKSPEHSQKMNGIQMETAVAVSANDEDDELMKELKKSSTTRRQYENHLANRRGYL
jgi:hypothetical protein